MIRPRFWLLVGAAALIVGGGVFTVARTPVPARAARVDAPVPAPAVITARRALPPGHILKPQDLADLRWPAGSPPPHAVMAGTPAADTLIGSVTRRAFSPGEMIHAGSVIAPGDRGFLAALIAPGRRAMAVPVDASTSAGGLIWPGDRVDLLLTQEIGEEGVPLGERVVSETILIDVRVLSTDQKLEPASVPSGPTEGAIEPRRVPATVTLEVTPSEAEAVAVAATLGRLHLALRGVAVDPALEPMPGDRPTWARSVSPALAAVRAPALSSSRSLGWTPPASAAPTPAPAARDGGPPPPRLYRGSERAS